MQQIVDSRLRFRILAVVAVAHLLGISWLLQQRSHVAPKTDFSSISLISVEADKPAVAPPPPAAPPAKLAKTFKPLTEISLSDVPPVTEAGEVGSSCAPQEAVLNAILLDPLAVDAIRNAPADMRSIADAIVIWNEGWNPQVVGPETSLYTVRGIVEQSLAALPPACLDEAVIGPRLLPIPDADGMRTSFIVIGSGTWTWRALLERPELKLADPTAPTDDRVQAGSLVPIHPTLKREGTN